MKTPEEILGLKVGADVEEVRAAYRALARRWHPDRFAPGPEREWANARMTEINSAYREALKAARMGSATAEGEKQTLEQARKLIEDGDFTTARALMMTMPTRCAEWNYLFGEILMKLADYNKALIYFSVAAHQNPDSRKYAEACARAAARKERPSLLKRALRGRF